MSLLRPIHWYHSRADPIWPVGPFKSLFSKKPYNKFFLQWFEAGLDPDSIMSVEQVLDTGRPKWSQRR